MNTLHEFLILLENEEIIPIFRFNRWGKTKAKGALGKLLALKYINKVQDGYQISEKGLEHLDKILSNLRQERDDWQKDGATFLSIKFPETQRHKRDKLRSFLKMSSYLKIGGVWIVPNHEKERIVELLKQNKLLDEILLVAGKILNKQILHKLSPFLEEIENLYSKWNLEVESKLSGLKKRQDRVYVAKRLIFEYALIRKRDLLPSGLIPANWIDEKAHEYYLQLKKYI